MILAFIFCFRIVFKTIVSIIHPETTDFIGSAWSKLVVKAVVVIFLLLSLITSWNWIFSLGFHHLTSLANQIDVHLVKSKMAAHARSTISLPKYGGSSTDNWTDFESLFRSIVDLTIAASRNHFCNTNLREIHHINLEKMKFNHRRVSGKNFGKTSKLSDESLSNTSRLASSTGWWYCSRWPRQIWSGNESKW